MSRLAPNKQLQRTVVHKVPRQLLSEPPLNCGVRCLLMRWTHSPLRAWRWFSTFLVVLLIAAGIAGWIDAPAPKDPVVPILFLTPPVLGCGYLAFVANDERLRQTLLWMRLYGPWLFIAIGVATVAGFLTR